MIDVWVLLPGSLYGDRITFLHHTKDLTIPEVEDPAEKLAQCAFPSIIYLGVYPPDTHYVMYMYMYIHVLLQMHSVAVCVVGQKKVL